MCAPCDPVILGRKWLLDSGHEDGRGTVRVPGPQLAKFAPPPAGDPLIVRDSAVSAAAGLEGTEGETSADRHRVVEHLGPANRRRADLAADVGAPAEGRTGVIQAAGAETAGVDRAEPD